MTELNFSGEGMSVTPQLEVSDASSVLEQTSENPVMESKIRYEQERAKTLEAETKLNKQKDKNQRNATRRSLVKKVTIKGLIACVVTIAVAIVVIFGIALPMS